MLDLSLGDLSNAKQDSSLDDKDMICWDYCPRSYHAECYDSKLLENEFESEKKWKCVECSRKKLKAHHRADA
eukprot:scaffold9874_cov51-Cyclotella_meneghiniana.AAC.6